MKKLFAILLSLAMLLSLSACELGQLAQLFGEVDSEDLEQLEGVLGQLEQLASSIPNLDPEQEVDAYTQWSSLVGYWNGADGVFFVLDLEDSHTAAFNTGIWSTDSGRGYGSVQELTVSGEDRLSALIYYPEVPAEGGSSHLPEEVVSLEVDYSGLERDGKIQIILNGEAVLCAFAGNTSAEAYRTYLDNLEG